MDTVTRTRYIAFDEAELRKQASETAVILAYLIECYQPGLYKATLHGTQKGINNLIRRLKRRGAHCERKKIPTTGEVQQELF